MERRKAEELGQVINRFLRESGLEAPLNEYRLLEAWPSVAGEAAARHTRKIEIRNQTLVVQLDSPALRANLQMMRAALVQRLNACVGATVIYDIRLV